MKTIIALSLCLLLTTATLAAERNIKQQGDLIPRENVFETIATSIPSLPAPIAHEVTHYCLEEEERWLRWDYASKVCDPENSFAWKDLAQSKNTLLKKKLEQSVLRLSFRPMFNIIASYCFEEEWQKQVHDTDTITHNASPHCQSFVSTTPRDPRTCPPYQIFRICDVKTGRQLQKINKKNKPSRNYEVIDYNNTYLLIGRATHDIGDLTTSNVDISLWDIQKNKMIKRLTDLNSVTLSPDEQSIAIAEGNKITISNIEDAQTRMSFIHTLESLPHESSPHEVGKIVYSPDGTHLAAIMKKPPRTIIVWNLSTQKAYKTINLKRLTFYLCTLIFSPNNKFIAWQQEGADENEHGPYIKIWNIEKNSAILAMPRCSFPHFLPDDSSILMIDDISHSIKIWDFTTEKLKLLHPDLNDQTRSVQIESAIPLPCGKIIIALDRNGKLHKWQLERMYMHIDKPKNNFMSQIRNGWNSLAALLRHDVNRGRKL